MTTRLSIRRATFGVLLATGAGLVLAGCGDGGGGEKKVVDVTDGSVRIEAHDNYFDVARVNTEAGPLEVSLEEKGASQHTFRIDGVDDFKLEVTPGDKSDSGTVTLDAGTYEFFCDVPGHRATMNGKIVVE